jgi:hypothetical protein
MVYVASASLDRRLICGRRHPANRRAVLVSSRAVERRNLWCCWVRTSCLLQYRISNKITCRWIISRLDEVTASLKQPFGVGASESSIKTVKAAASFTVDPPVKPISCNKWKRKKSQSLDIHRKKCSLQIADSASLESRRTGCWKILWRTTAFQF